MTAAPTLGEAIARLSRRLAAAGVEDAAGDARLLAAEALSLDRVALHVERDRPLDGADQAALERLAQRRENREPVSRILGRREFWSLDFEISPATLDPRPDSETLVQAVLDRLPDREAELRLVDLGTGSGCLLIALLHELPRAWGLGVDKSIDAARVARRNARRLGVGGRAAFLVSDWAAALSGPVDIVLSNPPYVSESEMAGLDPEVGLYDPREALLGGRDGMDGYRALATHIPRLLRDGGWAALEVGDGQALSVEAMLAAAGLTELAAISDLSGRKRCVCGKK